MKKSKVPVMCIVSMILILVAIFFGGYWLASNAMTAKTISREVTLPDAKEFPEIEWPAYGIATKLPVPDWSNKGEFLIETETRVWVYIGYTTYDDFENYVEACKDLGYTENTYSKTGIMYYGENDKGYGVNVHYNEYEHYVSIDAMVDGPGYRTRTHLGE